MSDSKTHDDDRRSDLAVLEANEYKQRRRLERILDALDKVQDTADEAWGEYIQGEIERDGLNIIIQRAVKNSIRECSVLLEEHHREQEGKERYWAGRPSNPIGKVTVPDGENVTIKGLKDFLESKEFYEAEIVESLSRRNKPKKTVTNTIEYTLPMRVSYNAYLRLKAFLDDAHDMEIKFEEMDDSLPNWGFNELDDDDIPDDVVVI